jgi:hypothetical protein
MEAIERQLKQVESVASEGESTGGVLWFGQIAAARNLPDSTIDQRCFELPFFPAEDSRLPDDGRWIE